ncbi:type II secretion system protein [uncultured Deinococcus sp.]|uniref:type IV pilus modification PilV family protein n=1 Tax=uncultured Deinococcus sp. TaxID=158789 RepID=UPI00338FC9F7
MRTGGFTLIEMLVALALFTVVATFTLSFQMSNVSANQRTEIRMQGDAAVRQTMERLRATARLPTSGSRTDTVTVGRAFSVRQEFCPATNDPPCTSSSTHVRVTASFADKVAAQADTVFTQVNTSSPAGGS